MTRRMVLLAIAAPGARGADQDEFLDGVAGLHWKLTRFLLAYLGCPLGMKDLAECRPSRARLDRRLWEQIRKDAKKVFDLEGE